jgi:hypothetical protein
MSDERSRKAVRAQRHRDRQHGIGLRQINVVVPDDEEARRAIKAVATRLTTEPSMAATIADLATDPALATLRSGLEMRLGNSYVYGAFVLGALAAGILCWLVFG